MQGAHDLRGRDLDSADGSIFERGRQTAVVRGELQFDIRARSRREERAASCVPEPKRIVERGGGNPLPVVAEADIQDAAHMPAQHLAQCARRAVMQIRIVLRMALR